MTNWLAIRNVKICINENNRQGCFLDVPFHVGDLKISVLINPLCVNQSCPTLCNPMDCSPPGSSVHEEKANAILFLTLRFLQDFLFIFDFLQFKHDRCRFLYKCPAVIAELFGSVVLCLSLIFENSIIITSSVLFLFSLLFHYVHVTSFVIVP